MIDYVHYPTLGCPALLGPEQELQVLVSLPAAADPSGVRFRLIDRHGQGGTFELDRVSDPEELAKGPEGKRTLFRYRLVLGGVPFVLFDLQVCWGEQQAKETQYNAVRRYEAITGTEDVILCGDSQYNADNQICLEKFIERVNRLDVAWIALIGDVCDNGVKGAKNLLRLAAGIESGPVTHYYRSEYLQAHQLLRTLHHPVILMPGNHDGMAANATYDEGNPSEVYTGPDQLNAVEYDGLHHFRCTFGPLFFSFDWADARYLCVNAFELTRQQRLGYHAIVANWGGWMRESQLSWVQHQLESGGGRRVVMLIHHDPRGGSQGERLGYYHRIRPYRFDRRMPTLKAYLAYALKHGRRLWQQEWMAPPDGDLAAHPVQELLRAMLGHRVWAVVMGHDNECWIESYFEGNDIFRTEPSTIRYASRAEIGDDELLDEVIDLLESGDYEAVAALLDRDEERGEAVLGAALAELAEDDTAAELTFARSPAEDWQLEAASAIHFIHVDDVGAYKFSKEKHFDDYGYVIAHLERGAPATLQRWSMRSAAGGLVPLEKD